MKVIIVGAGIAGLSTAWSLTKAGHDVTLIEQGSIPNPLAASGDHHRIIRRAYGKASGYADAITEAYDAWDALWLDLGEKHLDSRGFICISREAGDEAENHLNGMREGGYPLEMFTPEQAMLRYPFLERGSFRYVFFSPEGGALHCRRIASGMARWLRENGAALLEDSHVIDVDTARAGVRLADGSTLNADRVIVTAGAWVLKLFPELVTNLTTYRTAVVYLEPPADLRPVWNEAPVVLDIGGQMDGYIIPPTGGAGLKFGSGHHRFQTMDANYRRTPEAGEGEAIRDLFAPPFARLGEYRVRDVVTCAYTFTADEKFFAREFDRCVIVSACSGHGYKFGAAVGRRVGRYVEDGNFPALESWLRAESAA